MSYSTIRSKFRSDLNWNLISFLIVALSGLSINLLITRYYGFKGLGFFNLLLVFFLVLSQLLSWGIHLSVQKLIPQYRRQAQLCRQLFSSALVISVGLGQLGMLLLYLFQSLPGRLMGDSLLREGFIYSLAGIGFSVVNRIFLSFLNGMRFMKSFALYSALKVLLLLFFLGILLVLEIHVVFLGLVFSLSELLLGLLLFQRTRPWLTPLGMARFRKLLRLHFWYGNRGMPGNVVTNFQSKIDIFILGLFVSETMLGVYSFAVFVADGFLQLFYMFRGLVNPIITHMFFDRSPRLLQRFMDRSIRRFYKLFLLLGAMLALLYPPFLLIFDITAQLQANLIVFYLLLMGVLLSSGYLPFQFFFNQIGMPQEQTRFQASLFIITSLLLLLLVPVAGAYGAACGLLLANLYQLIYLKKKMKRLLWPRENFNAP